MPYPYLDSAKDLTFDKANIANLPEDESIHNWGIKDGTGLPIKLSFEDYYQQYIYAHDFINAPSINYISVRTDLVFHDKFDEVFPNSIIVEYYFPGFEEEYLGMDWESLKLVFQEIDGTWYLVAIIRGVWTI